MGDFILRIKGARKGKKWSQYRLAKEANVSREMIAKLECGKHIPKITTAEKLCRALHITFTIGEINEKDKNQRNL